MRMVFAGQYSSGKSTLIKALTGRKDIATGAGITTETIRDYDWNGITVTDTPGIHTSIRPQHDDASYRAISEADLLVFVVTNEAFDEDMGSHFQDLAIDHQKAAEAVVVVNKMDRHTLGNCLESRDILRETIQEPLQPFTPEQMKVSFTSAVRALEAEREEDPDTARDLREEGNIQELIANLNALAREKGLMGKYTTSLYRIQHVIAEAMEQPDGGDLASDALLLVYNQNIQAIADASECIRNEVGRAIARAKDRISSTAEVVITALETDKDEEMAKEMAEDGVRKACGVLDEDISKAMLETLPELHNRIEGIQQGFLHQHTAPGFSGKGDSAERTARLRMVNSLAGRLGEAIGTITRNNPAAAAGVSGLATFSGSGAHRAVLSIGRTFGYSFRPWQAARLAQTISKVGTTLSLASAVLDVYLEWRRQMEEEKREEERLKAIRETRGAFEQTAQDVGDQAWKDSEAAVRELLDEPLEEITNARDELVFARQERDDELETLSRVNRAAANLIGEIHTAGGSTEGQEKDE